MRFKAESSSYAAHHTSTLAEGRSKPKVQLSCERRKRNGLKEGINMNLKLYSGSQSSNIQKG